MDRPDPKPGEHVSGRLAAYLDQELSAEAATEVESHLAECSGCSGLLESMKSTGEAVDQALLFAKNDHVTVERLEAYRLKETEDREAGLIATHLRLCSHCREALANLSYLSDAGTETAREPGKRGVAWTKRPWWLALRLAGVAAAVAAVGFAVGVWYMRLGVEPDREELLARLSEVEPPLYLESRPRAGSLDPAASERLRAGMDAYTAGRYREAIEHLAPFVEQHGDSQQAIFFLAACYLLTDQPAPAILLLEGLLRDPGPYAERAHWYLGKAYLRTVNIGAARRELEQVVTLEGRYRDPARSLLEELRGLQ